MRTESDSKILLKIQKKKKIVLLFGVIYLHYLKKGFLYLV